MAFYASVDWQDFLVYFATPQDTVNGVIAIIGFVLSFAFPLWVFSRIHSNFSKLHTKHMDDLYGTFLDGNRVDDYHSAQYSGYFMVRRLFTCAIIIFMKDWYFW